MHLEAYAHTDTGPVREHNEDSMLIDLEAGVFVVADGMGGHAAGEVASAMAVEAVHETLVGAPDPDETRLVREHAGVGAIVLECTNMVPYAADLRQSLGLPVFSIYTFVQWFQSALLPRAFDPRLQDPRVG